MRDDLDLFLDLKKRVDDRQRKADQQQGAEKQLFRLLQEECGITFDQVDAEMVRLKKHDAKLTAKFRRLLADFEKEFDQ